MRRRPLGFSLIEVLATLAIIGILLGLLLPALGMAREAARRSLCAHHLKQLGLAVLSYAETWQCLPPGRVLDRDPRIPSPRWPCDAGFAGASCLIRILPFLEASNVSHCVNYELSIYAPENTTIHRHAPGVYLCPSDGYAGPQPVRPGALAPFPEPAANWGVTRSSYGANFGSVDIIGVPAAFPDCRPTAAVRRQMDGAFHDFSPIRLSDITDGLSKTIFFAELSASRVQALDQSPANPSRTTLRLWLSSNLADTLYAAKQPPNWRRQQGLDLGDARNAISDHAGGVNVLFGDGSVSFISETIDSWALDADGEPLGARRVPNDPSGLYIGLPTRGIWQALATIGGMEPTDR